MIDKGYREHNDELAAAFTKIYEALRHWGLEQSGPCSLVDNVKHVIQLCAERGKAHFEQKDKIERLNDQIDSQSKVIAELTNQRDQWEKLAEQRAGEVNRHIEQIEIMDFQRNRKDKEIKALKDTCDIRQGIIEKGHEVSYELRKLLAERNAEIESKTKVIESLKKSVEVLEMAGKTRQQFADTDREVNHKKTVEIEELAKQLSLARKKRQAIVEAGNKMADRFRLICDQYWLYDDELINSKQVIQLWEDNTTP